MNSRNGVASCKRGNWRLLGKVFESKPIKRRGKIPFQQFKAFNWTFKANVFSNFQQRLYYCTWLPKPIHLQMIKQYGSSSNNEERMRGLNKNISQDAERDWNNDWCIEDDKAHEEVSRRSKSSDRDERSYLIGKH